jgi:dipeptidase
VRFGNTSKGSPTNPLYYNFPRVNALQRRLAGLNQPLAATGHAPVFLRPSRPLSWWDVAAGMREHYAGTDKARRGQGAARRGGRARCRGLALEGARAGWDERGDSGLRRGGAARCGMGAPRSALRLTEARV